MLLRAVGDETDGAKFITFYPAAILAAFGCGIAIAVAAVTLLRMLVGRVGALHRTLEATFESCPDAVLVVDENDRVSIANQRAAELFASTQDSLMGSSIARLIPEYLYFDPGTSVASPLDRDIAGDAILSACRTDGSTFSIRIEHRVVRIGTVVRTIVTVHDVTEHRLLAAAADRDRRAEIALEERQRVADQLRIGEDRLRDFLELGAGWIWEQDADLRLSWINAGSLAAAADPAEEIGQRRWDCQDTDNDPAAWEQHCRDLSARRPFQDFRYRVVARDGQVRFKSISGKPLFDTDGTFLGYRGVGRDITAQIQAEHEIVASKSRAEQAEALFRDALDSVSEGILIWDSADRLLMGNHICRQRYIHVADVAEQSEYFVDILRKSLAAGAFPAAEGRKDAWLAERLEQHRAAVGTHDMALRDGEWVRITERRMRGGGIVTLYVDITELKRTELALRETEARFERAQAVAGIGSWEYDIQSRTWFLSKEVYRARQLDPATYVPLLGQDRPHVHPEDRAIMREWMADLQAGRKRGPIEERLILADGEQRIHRVEGQAIHDADGVAIRIAGTMQDITGQRLMERQLAQAQKMEALGAVTGGMAHDFNNLLGVIILSLELATARMTDNDRLKPLVTEALAAAERGADLIRSLLAFARQQVLHPVQIDLNERLRSMHRLLSRVVGEDIVMVLDLAPELWPVVADPSQLEACVMNLATNARDAMPKGGTLTITTENRHIDADCAEDSSSLPPGDYTMIAVADTGVGMAPAVMAKIFDPFFSTKGPGHGTGLGLSMVFGFATQSGGHVSAYSEPGAGTTIRICLPRTGSHARSSPEHRTADAGAATPTGRGETILIVEDNDLLRRVVSRQLAELGYRIFEAGNAAAAVACLEQHHVDLVFSDVVMPGGMDGFELATRVTAQWPGTAVVLTSGFAGHRESERLPESLASVGLLTKPYNPAALARLIRDTLDGAGA